MSGGRRTMGGKVAGAPAGLSPGLGLGLADDPIPKLPRFMEETGMTWMMLVRFAEAVGQLAKELSLPTGQVCRRLHVELDDQIALFSTP